MALSYSPSLCLPLLCGTTRAAEGLPKVAPQRAWPNLSFDRPLWLCEAPDATGRTFLMEQPGRILILPSDRDGKETKVFLDISSRHPDQDAQEGGNEEGLLGMAFHPDFKSNGKLYLHYDQQEPRQAASSAKSASRSPTRTKLIFRRSGFSWKFRSRIPTTKGGSTIFGPDGYLYISFGDGGTILGDPHKNGQSLKTLLAKILRIDVNSKTGDLPYGIPKDNPFVNRGGGASRDLDLRNAEPVADEFRHENRGLVGQGDVGQEKWEEVDLITKGGNYGQVAGPRRPPSL